MADSSSSQAGSTSKKTPYLGAGKSLTSSDLSDSGLVNALASARSPYLRSHAKQPVAWQEWSAETLASAARQNRPIFLSIGYHACHWCHVMAQESFDDVKIADILNKNFVNIKVDREEYPDLDHIYQQALGLLGQPGGWPLSLFLTSNAEPFWGGTYFPPVPRFGRPAFSEMLLAVIDSYTHEYDKVKRNVAALRAALSDISYNRSGDTLAAKQIESLAEEIIDDLDPIYGGLGEAPKFPQIPILQLLWSLAARTGFSRYRQGVIQSMTHICQGGLHDHIGGGFMRYATDRQWRIPHYEKMLYDNAVILRLLTSVWIDTKQEVFAERIRGIVGWLKEEMVVDSEAFASSLSAVQNGVEGAYYLWRESEIKDLLKADARFFQDMYHITAEGNVGDGLNLPYLAPDLTPLSHSDQRRLAGLCQDLRQHRRAEMQPGRDDKILADWNGLMITALVEAGEALEQPEWIHLAARAFAFIRSQMVQEGRLFHNFYQGEINVVARLDDLAFMAEASLALYQVTGQQEYLDQAENWVAQADEYFWDHSNRGYFMTPRDGHDPILRPKTIHDEAYPSGNAAMLSVLTRLFYLTGTTNYISRAHNLIEAFQGEVVRSRLGMAGFVDQVLFFKNALHFMVVGDRRERSLQALRRTLFSRFLPHGFVSYHASLQESGTKHPVYSNIKSATPAAIYICRGQSCSLPITQTQALEEVLDGLSKHFALSNGWGAE